MDEKLLELIRKYDRPGPRYTSYPPAPLFSADFGPNEYLSAIQSEESSLQNLDLSLYFHLPFCDTLCYFCGCTTVITHDRRRIEEYIGYLKKEIDMLAARLSPRRRIVQMHWGGGSPTYLSPEQILDLGTHIRRSFRFAGDAEVSVEVDPRELKFDHLLALRRVGFNRMSVGVQDFDPIVQTAVNRVQSEYITRQAIDWSRDLGFSSLNIDLIYGLPFQSAASFEKTLSRICGMFPERIAVYNFAYVPRIKPHQRVILAEDLPLPESKLEILFSTIDRLSAAGYEYIGMDHFARPDDELARAQRNGTLHRNFQGYSTKAGSDMYGLGMSAISHFGTNYAQNAKTLPEYYRSINEGKFATSVGYRMTPDDQLRKFVIMRLMCDLGLDTVDTGKRFEINFDSYFRDSLEKLQPLIEDGLVTSAPGFLSVTSPGRLFLRNIAMCFDAYLEESPQRKPLYSRTV
jgi:oxygen-independent coproporphyrinogen III oxidase